MENELMQTCKALSELEIQKSQQHSADPPGIKLAPTTIICSGHIGSEQVPCCSTDFLIHPCTFYLPWKDTFNLGPVLLGYTNHLRLRRLPSLVGFGRCTDLLPS